MIFGNESFDNIGDAIQKASGSLKGYISGLDVAKLKTIALRAATVAFEAALTLGVTFAITKLLEALDKFSHAEEQAAENEKKMRQETVDSIRAYNDEAKESQTLSNSYVELVSTTSDLTTEKEKLLEIQEKINKGIDDQTDKVDLLNKSLSENIELTAKQRLEEAQNVISENQATYESIVEGERASYSAMQTYGDKDVARAISEVEAATGKRISGTLSEQSEQLEEILKLYHDISDYNKQYYNDVEKGKQAIDAQLSDWNEIKETVDAARRTVQELTIAPEMQKDFDGLVDKAKQLYDELNGADSASQEFLISEKLKDVKSELYDLVDGNTELTQIADNLFSSFDKGVESILGDAGDLKAAWLNTFDDMQKGSLKNISTMVSALQDLSEGKGIAANTFWQLVEFDNDGLLNGAKLVGDKFIVTQENMIELKDKYIKKQIDELQNTQASVKLERDRYEQEVKRYELELESLKVKNVSQNSDEYKKVLNNLTKAKEGAKAFGDEWERNNWLIQYLNQALGNTVDIQKQLEAQQKQANKELKALEKQLNDYQKAYETKVDNIVKGLEAEGHELEKQKDSLEDELDILEKQKDSIDDIIGKYDAVNSLVQKTIDKEIKSLEDERDAIKKNYDAQIKALQDENKEREDSLEYAQKLKALENAKNNKVRVYDEARGWHYASNQDDIKKAQNDLSSFETRKAIELLEAQRDALIDSTEDIIDSKKAYAEQFKNLSDLIQTEADEQLAAELLGADWRERIADGDIELFKKFSEEYRKHNGDLKRLTETEIKYKKEQIDAKNKEIDANKQRITSWKDLKSTISTAVDDIKNANADYMSLIGEIQLNENSNLEERGNAIEHFKNRVTQYIDEIGQKQSEIDRLSESIENASTTATFNIETNVADVSREMIDFINDYRDAIVSMREALDSSATGYGVVNSSWDAKLAEAANKLRLLGYSEGGVADYTGLAMLHGRKNAPETIFNAHDSAKLYDLVHNTPNLMASMLNQAKSKVGGASVSIGSITVMANNPQEFTKGLDQHLDRYFQRKLTASYTSK